MPRGSEIAEKSLDKSLVRHLLDIGASGKGLFRTGNQHAPDTAVGFETIHGSRKFTHQRAIERIQRLGPIETDQSNSAARLDNNVFHIGRSLRYFWHTGQ